jgi:hypothetical protein
VTVVDLRIRLLLRPGGQGVAGSSPAVPTGRRLVANSTAAKASAANAILVVEELVAAGSAANGPQRTTLPMSACLGRPHGSISAYLP